MTKEKLMFESPTLPPGLYWSAQHKKKAWKKYRLKIKKGGKNLDSKCSTSYFIHFPKAIIHVTWSSPW